MIATPTPRASRRNVLLPALFTGGLALLALGSVALLAPEAPPIAPSANAPTVIGSPASVGPSSSPRVVWRAWTQGAPTSATVEPTPDTVTLALDATDADPSRVHAVGVASLTTASLARGVRLRARLDWRPPENASYRSAGLLLTTVAPTTSATAAGGLALDLDLLRPAAWLEVVGVPPGRTARLFGAVRTTGRATPLVTEGWPEERAGRAIREVVLEVEVRPGRVVLRADGHELASVDLPFATPTDPVWAVLYTTSHANYPPRPVTFEALGLGPARGAQEVP